MHKSWNKYFEATKDLPPSKLLKEAMTVLNAPTKQALDLGCGAGRDTRYLLEQGFVVTALDSDPAAGEYIMALPHQDNVRFICDSFSNFSFEDYSFINASYSLPFSDKGSIPSLFTKIKDSLVTGGVFSGQLFGFSDDWNAKDSLLSFHTKEGVEKLLEGTVIIKLSESEYDAKTVAGDIKHWHVFDIIAHKASQKDRS